MVQRWRYSPGERRHSSLHKGLQLLQGTPELLSVADTLFFLLMIFLYAILEAQFVMTERKTHNYLAGHENSWRGKGKKKKGKCLATLSLPPNTHKQVSSSDSCTYWVFKLCQLLAWNCYVSTFTMKVNKLATIRKQNNIIITTCCLPLYFYTMN